MTHAAADAITALLERVKDATGPDRELDARIDAWLKERTGFQWIGHYYNCNQLPAAGGDDVEHYTASIDAALALVEQMGWCGHMVHIGRYGVKGGCSVNICRPNDMTTDADGEGKTLPLAILMALLTALENAQ